MCLSSDSIKLHRLSVVSSPMVGLVSVVSSPMVGLVEYLGFSISIVLVEYRCEFGSLINNYTRLTNYQNFKLT